MLRALLLFSLAAGGIVLTLVAVNLATVPRLSRGARLPPLERCPAVSVVIPARNEEREIETAVRSHLAQDYPDLEVVLLEDGSSDRTPEIADRLAAQDPRLRVLPGREPPPGWLGKPHALQLGAEAARGELLLFADADVRYHPQALREAVGRLEADGLDFLALVPRFVMRGFWENVLLPNIPLTYFFGLGVLANSDRARWIAAGGGAGNLVRRSAYQAAGGHAAIRSSVIDDVRLAFLLKAAGFRCRAVRAEDRVSVRMYRGFREIWDGFAKNVAYLFQGRTGLVVFLLAASSLVPALLPTLVLGAALLGAPVDAGNLRLAGIGFVQAIVARGAVALALGHPLWTCLTNPLMAAVWAGIIGRSLYWKLVKREVRWRGRRYDAEQARF